MHVCGCHHIPHSLCKAMSKCVLRCVYTTYTPHIPYDTGLDEAILGSMNSCGDPEQDSKKIADLLKYGAHSLVSSSLASRNLNP